MKGIKLGSNSCFTQANFVILQEVSKIYNSNFNAWLGAIELYIIENYNEHAIKMSVSHSINLSLVEKMDNLTSKNILIIIDA